VSFEYEPGVPVLRDLSFEVRPGEIVGIVGPSGSGKSTLVQLLLRLREPTAGTFLADGRDARRLSLVDWYQHVTFVPQDPHLFAGTVADNIRFFRPSIDDAAIERSAKLAHVHDDIQAWPTGYATYVGERGGQLSGGQRQRLCIARALVEEPEVMVLDEPTSALDVRSESLIRETIADLRPDTTVFIIAHRLSTLAICDRIMVILNGVMEGFDEPSKLESSNPFYREALRLSGMRS
jgi:ABC-type multidrug transport system fused ATPase/permease subunit